MPTTKCKISFSIAALVLTVIFGATVFGQNAEDTTDGRFHDKLLDNFVGKWTVAGIVHGQEFKNIDLEAEWVLNHQFLKIHEKGREIVPWLQAAYESFYYIGYDHSNKRYVAHLMNIMGSDNQVGYLLFGNRAGNEVKFISQLADPATGSFDSESFMWLPESKSWHWVCRLVNKGKEEEPYLDLKVVGTKQ
jgi:hypothetical protein